MDGPGRRALAAEHQRGLAGEGRGHDARHALATVTAALVRIEPKLGEREFQDGGLAGAGIAEQPEHLLLAWCDS